MHNIIKEFNLEENKSYSIVGISKNSGKTTLLNYILKNVESLNKNYFITSIGIDGESIDQVTKTSKPDIYISNGNMFTSAKEFIRDIIGNFEIIENINEGGALGDIYVCKAIDNIKVKVCGPRNNEKLKKLSEKYKKYHNFFFIDGALDRISLSSPLISDGVIFSISPSYSNSENEFLNLIQNLYYKFIEIKKFDLNEFDNFIFNKKFENNMIRKCYFELTDLINKENNVILLLNDLSIIDLKFESIIGNEEKIYQYIDKLLIIYIPGAITDKSIEQISNKIKDELIILISDPSKNFISLNRYNLLIKKKINFYYINKPELKGISISTFHPYNKLIISPLKLKEIVKSYFNNYKIIDLYYD